MSSRSRSHRHHFQYNDAKRHDHQRSSSKRSRSSSHSRLNYKKQRSSKFSHDTGKKNFFQNDPCNERRQVTIRRDDGPSDRVENTESTSNLKIPSVSDYLADIWSRVLMSGLDEEMRKLLLKKYPLPSHREYLRIMESGDKLKNLARRSFARDCSNHACRAQLMAGIEAVKAGLSAVFKMDDKPNVSGEKDLIAEKLIDDVLLLSNLFYDLTTDTRNEFKANVASGDVDVMSNYRKVVGENLTRTTS